MTQLWGEINDGGRLCHLPKLRLFSLFLMNISRRLNQVPASPIRKLVPLADAAKKRGTHVIHLNIGDPDIETPRVMTDRLRQWQGGIPYAHSQGDAELIAALLKYYRGLGADYLKAENIQVTVGGSEALTMAMAAVADPGEEILVFEPFFPSYHSLAVVQGLKVVPVTTSIADGFHLPKLEQFEALVTPKTRAILLTNPNNPTGRGYRREEVDGLVELVRNEGIFFFAVGGVRGMCFVRQAR